MVWDTWKPYNVYSNFYDKFRNIKLISSMRVLQNKDME